MAKIIPIQHDFTGGILSPKLHSRSDLPEYKSSISDAVNFTVSRHGPVESRDGLLHIDEIAGTVGKLLPMQLSPNSPLGDSFVLIVTDDGNLIVSGAISEGTGSNALKNGDFNAGVSNWARFGDTNGGRIDFGGSRAKLTASDVAVQRTGITQKFPVKLQNTEYLLDIEAPSGTSGVEPLVLVSVGTSPQADDIVPWGLNLKQPFNTGTNTELYLNIAVTGGDFDDEAGDIITVTDFRYIENATIKVPATSGGELTFAHPWSAEEIPHLTSVMPPDGDGVFILSQYTPPYLLSYTEDTDTWLLDELAFAGMPADWGADSWPTVATFFQGRCWWGGVADAPSTFYASQTGAYTNMNTGSNPSDGLEFKLAQRGLIRWMEGLRNLIIGTDVGEYIVTAEGGVITPNDVNVVQQSANGGKQVDSIPIGNLVLYASLDGRKLRSTTYQWNEQAWVSRDLMFSAEHLTKTSSIAQITYARDPESIIWILTDAGTLLGCTFEPYTQTLGWHRHITDGTILSILALNRDNSSKMYMLVLRQIDGVEKMFLEKFDDALAMDAASIVTNTTPSDQITGLTHLAGRTVTVVCDDAVHPDVTLDSNGDGVLEYPCTELMVGLPFECSLQTLYPDYGSIRGSAMPHKKRWNRVYARLYASRHPKINGQLAPERSTQTLMDAPEAYRDYDVSVALKGWGDGRITITQDLPVKTRISGIFGELNQENL